MQKTQQTRAEGHTQKHLVLMEHVHGNPGPVLYRRHVPSPPSCHAWGNTYLERQSLLWEDTTCSPQLYLKGKPLVLRASQRQCQAVGVKISTGNRSVTTACTGKNRRRPTIQTWNPEPLCDSISHNERYTKPKGRQTTSIVIL